MKVGALMRSLTAFDQDQEIFLSVYIPDWGQVQYDPDWELNVEKLVKNDDGYYYENEDGHSRLVIER